MENKIPLKCIECGRIIWAPIEDIGLEMACPECLREERKAMDGFDPIRYADWVEDTRLPDEYNGE